MKTKRRILKINFTNLQSVVVKWKTNLTLKEYFKINFVEDFMEKQRVAFFGKH